MKVIHMTSALDGGGVERLLFDYYSNLDHENVRFDFIKVDSPVGILERHLLEMGSSIFSLPPMKDNLIKYCRVLRRILRDGQYDVIHCHGGYKACVALYIAKKCKVPIRIAHSHAFGIREHSVHRVFRKLMTFFTKRNATALFACGEEAGKWMWGKQEVASGHVYLMRNAICTNCFSYDSSLHTYLKSGFGLDGKYVIGCVGRLCYQKNQEFLLEAFAEVKKIIPCATLVLIGGGPAESNIRAKIEALGLSLNNDVYLLGVRDDVKSLYNLFDLYVLPSNWEGLPVSLIEAQANGLPTIVSALITKEARLLPNSICIPLEKMKWVDAIVGFFESNSQRIQNASSIVRENGYEIKDEAFKLQCEYLKLMEK